MFVVKYVGVPGAAPQIHLLICSPASPTFIPQSFESFFFLFPSSWCPLKETSKLLLTIGMKHSAYFICVPVAVRLMEASQRLLHPNNRCCVSPAARSLVSCRNPRRTSSPAAAVNLQRR